MLLEVLHLSSSKAGANAVHAHVDHKLLVRIEELSQRVEGLLSDWIETDVNDLQLLQTLELIE